MEEQITNADPKRIKTYWESIGKSACPDDIVRDMSIDTIAQHLPDSSSVLDLGCGNGYCTFKFAETAVDTIIGVDYSQASIDQASKARSLYPQVIKNKVEFLQGDALNLDFYNGRFDIVVTIRCLINVGDYNNQLRALSEIARVLKQGGTYLMCENTISGLDNINHARGLVGLHEIKTRWHNNYIDDTLFFSHVKKFFDVIEEHHFASTYYLISRVINAWICKKNNTTPQYDDAINLMGSKLPAVGEFSPMRLYELRKL